MMMGVVGARVLYKRGGTKSALSEICMATNAARVYTLSFISSVVFLACGNLWRAASDLLSVTLNKFSLGLLNPQITSWSQNFSMVQCNRFQCNTTVLNF